MRHKSPRLAARAVLLHKGRILMVNAYADQRRGLMCAPGGGVNSGASLPDNLRREVFEETGVHIRVGAPCLINEFNDPQSEFHQVDIYFRCTLEGSDHLNPDWRDSENVVSQRRWVSAQELSQMHHKPDSLWNVAFGDAPTIIYDPLEPIVR